VTTNHIDIPTDLQHILSRLSLSDQDKTYLMTEFSMYILTAMHQAKDSGYKSGLQAKRKSATTKTT
jgi:hypothetical protein